jgi:hypothetical protein
MPARAKSKLDDGNPPPPLEPATAEDVAAAGCTHTGAEAMFAFAGDTLGLISALRHDAFPCLRITASL